MQKEVGGKVHCGQEYKWLHECVGMCLQTTNVLKLELK